MQDDLVQYVQSAGSIAAVFQPVSVEAAKPYLKALVLMTMLLAYPGRVLHDLIHPDGTPIIYKAV